MNSTSQRATEELLRENVSLDFINPIVVDSESDYFFSSYENLMDWGVAAGAVSQAQAEALVPIAARAAGTKQRVFDYAKHVRATLDAVLRAAATGQSAKPHLADLNDVMNAALAHRRLSVRDHRIAWEWPFELDLRSVFWPVIPAAIDLLMSSDLAHLKACGGCGWLFLDSSKNHSRKWCRMSDCGNVAKVRSHRQRDRSQER
jgi:predicted RNA-binding Zn ribbon-like protein